MRLAAVSVLMAVLLTAAHAADESQLVLEDLQCRGNEQTPCKFILGYVYAKPGDVVNEEEVQNAKMRLSALPNFSSVSIFLEKGASRGKARLIVEVHEADHIVKQLAAGWRNFQNNYASASSNNQEQFISGQWSNLNLFRAGKVLNVALSGDRRVYDPPYTIDDYQAQLQYADPQLFDSKRYFLVADTRFSRTEGKTSQYPFKEGSSQTDDWLADIALGRRLWDFSHIVLTYGYENATTKVKITTVDGLFFMSSGNSSISRRVSLGYGWEYSDDYYFPTHGSKFDVTAQHSLYSAASNSATDDHVSVTYDHIWTTASAFTWTLDVGGGAFHSVSTYDSAPFYQRDSSDGYSGSIALTLAKPWPASKHSNVISRGRWYVEAKIDNGITRLSSEQLSRQIYHVQVGTRLEMPKFAIVDLFVSGDFTR